MATPADATANRLAQFAMVASVDRQPRMPMTPDEYSNWRRQLWDQRGPNVKTPTYNELLPCYKAALERCRQQVGEVTAPPRAHPRRSRRLGTGGGGPVPPAALSATPFFCIKINRRRCYW